jgi:hypothetical protein
VLTVPVSPLIGSDCCSLTFNSPEWVDLLVTFIACEIVTGWGLTEILGSHPGRFWGRNATAARPETPTSFILPCGNPQQVRLRPFISRLTWFDQPARRQGARHGHREMHQRV